VCTPSSELGRVGLIGSQAVTWGLTYVFISVAVEEIAPSFLVGVRAWGALMILVMLRRADARAALACLWRRPLLSFALGTLNLAFPFWLMAWGQRTVSSSVTSIVLATSPAMVAIAANWIDPSERLRWPQWVGVFVATAGVALAVGATPDQLGTWDGLLAVTGASLAYAMGSLVAKTRWQGGGTWEQAIVTLLAGAILLTPPAIASGLPHGLGGDAVGSALYLAVVATPVAYVLMYRAINVGGANFALQPNYFAPACAITGGAIIIGTAVTPGLVAGTLIAIAGVVVVSRTGQAVAAIPSQPSANRELAEAGEGGA
jgi:drug/metabolite transporter (DMT)-like permease